MKREQQLGQTTIGKGFHHKNNMMVLSNEECKTILQPIIRKMEWLAIGLLVAYPLMIQWPHWGLLFN